jgi:thioredoxin-dependent peroxiredoxin
MELKQGDNAPDFTVNDQNGKTVSLHDFKGKKVVLYFYPKDDTPGCTAEACNLRDNFSELKKMGIVVLGVSTDDEKSHKKFEEKFSLPFTLLADTDKKIVNEYGLWGEKKFMGKTYMGTVRATFLINEEGKIDHIIEKVDTKNHTEQIKEVWGL